MEEEVMAVIRKRNKLVSFRVSEQEYEVLQNLILTEGARSISDFARGALCDVLDHNVGAPRASNGIAQRGNGNGMNQTLEQLIATMGELNQSISRLSSLVENTASKSWER
jgi:hypothetical protein